MIRAARTFVAGLIVAAGTGAVAFAGSLPAAGSKPSACERHGTAIDFYATPSAAAAAAKKAEKLVFVLHVSGLFETPEFT